MEKRAAILTCNLGIWSDAVKRRSTAGRGRTKKVILYGIEKLRELILDLALSGKLVLQDENDEPAVELLKRIRTQINSATRGRRSPPNLNELPGRWKIPSEWLWTDLESVTCYIQRGKSPKYDDNGSTRVISQKCVQWSGFDLGAARRIADDTLSAYDEERFLRPGDILWNSTGTGTVGRAIVFENLKQSQIVVDSHVTILRPVLVNPWFIRTFISSSKIQSRMQPEHPNPLVSGTTNQVELNASAVRTLPLPLPPLAEQHRIVAKVNELMALCDELETSTFTANEAHQLLVTSLLDALTNSKTSNDFKSCWNRIDSHFDTLFTTEDSIENLKQAILQLAVMGKLVPQLSQDEPASNLLQKIKLQQSRNVSTGKLKESRYKEASNGAASDFTIPSTWIWTSLGEIATKITDGAHHTPAYQQQGIPFLSVKDMSNGKLDFSDAKYISPDQHAQLYLRCNPEFGDLLITKVGTTGVPAIVDTRAEFSLFVSVALVKAPWDLIDVNYLYYVISSPFLKKQSADGTQGIGNKNLVLKTLAGFSIPLPPLQEQRRIVTKIKELFKLCSALQGSLAEINRHKQQLAAISTE